MVFFEGEVHVAWSMRGVVQVVSKLVFASPKGITVLALAREGLARCRLAGGGRIFVFVFVSSPTCPLVA